MTSERFERLRNLPFAQNIKQQVGDDQWAQWERGDFSASASAAEQAAAAAEGRPLDVNMTDAERAEAEALLTSGSVPNFNEGGQRRTIESENEYYRQALARRDDALVPPLPVALRFYGRYLIAKYDANGNGNLERSEWEDKLLGAQAIDLDGDWVLTNDEVLFYLARFAKDKTIANPTPSRAVGTRTNQLVGDEEKPVLIRTASAAPKRTTLEELERERAEVDAEDFADLSDSEFKEMMTEGNPALEGVEDEKLLGVLLQEMDESMVREYAAPPQTLVGAPVWFLARDANGDGQLTLREFAPNLTAEGIALFGKLDADADGVVTAEEAKAQKQEKKSE